MKKSNIEMKKNKLIYIIIVILIISTVFIIKGSVKKDVNTIETDSYINATVEIKEMNNEINEKKEVKEKNEETEKNNKAISQNNHKKSSKNNSVNNKKTSSTKSSKKKVNQTSTTNKTAQKDEITYIKGVLLVNKKYTLPKTYNPGVNSTAKSAFNDMKKGATKDGISLKIVSDFRSYNTQQAIYSKNLKKHGERIANRFSAKAGQSEHQTGLAFDLNKANRTFVGTKEAKWLAKNCYKYGFIIRYPQGKESITGYVYEPWHVRYVGCEIAKEIYHKGICLEEYLGVN